MLWQHQWLVIHSMKQKRTLSMDATGAEGSESRPKKPRTSTPKVKTGCVTCKARRIKCDETKPSCLRCSNFGRICGGYISKEDAPVPKDPVPTPPRRLLAKTAHPEMPSSAIVLFEQAPVNPLSIGVSFQSDTDYHHLCHFRDVTSVELCSGYEPRLWNSTIIRACNSLPIKQLVIAIGAMSKAIKKNPSGLQDSIVDADYHYALLKYGEALRGLTEMVPSDDESVKIAWIGSLLIFCLENLQNDSERAILQIQSALNVAVKAISEKPSQFYFPRTASAESRLDLSEICLALMRLDRPVRKLAAGLPTYPPNRIFSLLFDQEPLDPPSSFTSISEGRVYLEDIMWRIKSDEASDRDLVTEDRLEHVNPARESYISESSQSYNDRLAKWNDAFSPLLNHARLMPETPFFMATATLHVQALEADLLIKFHCPSNLPSPETSVSPRGRSGPSYTVAGPWSAEQVENTQTGVSTGKKPESLPLLQYVESNSISHAILDFSREIVAHPKFVKSFVFDAGIISPLMTLIMLCPSRILKRQAVEILKSMRPRQEGMWNSTTCAEAAEKTIQADES